jgi:hypothetical protein
MSNEKFAGQPNLVVSLGFCGMACSVDDVSEYVQTFYNSENSLKEAWRYKEILRAVKKDAVEMFDRADREISVKILKIEEELKKGEV